MVPYEPIALAVLFNAPVSLSLFDQPTNTCRGPQVTEILIRKFSLASSYFLPFRLNNRPHHAVIEYPQPMVLLSCERPGFTSVQRKNSHKRFSSVENRLS
jgi:hypothetical protein